MHAFYWCALSIRLRRPNPYLEFFSKDLAEKITSAEQETIGDVVSREATILNVDIRGFTPLTQRLTPREQIALITEYQARIVPVISAHGSRVDKFLGDGIMAYFGVLSDSDTHAMDAFKCMKDILKASDGWNRDRNDQGLSLLSSIVPVPAARSFSASSAKNTALNIRSLAMRRIYLPKWKNILNPKGSGLWQLGRQPRACRL